MIKVIARVTRTVSKIRTRTVARLPGLWLELGPGQWLAGTVVRARAIQSNNA